MSEDVLGRKLELPSPPADGERGEAESLPTAEINVAYT
jgi:hypothetical protein